MITAFAGSADETIFDERVVFIAADFRSFSVYVFQKFDGRKLTNTPNASIIPDSPPGL
jgi:hypothetical protein